MSQVFKPHLEILPQAQWSIWQDLVRAKSLGFVLYGGTAIALRLGHRTSVDFDFFSDQAMHSNELRTAFPFLNSSTVLQESADTLTVLAPVTDTEDTVKISFFASLTMGRVGKPTDTDDGVLRIASLDDLMATKLKVILQRVEAKDYLDVAALSRAGVSIRRGLGSARAMYGREFQPAECLKALAYFEGGDLTNLPLGDRETLIAAAKDVRDIPIVTRASDSLGS